MSHVRQNAVRMEVRHIQLHFLALPRPFRQRLMPLLVVLQPTWMIIGHASGVAAAMALKSGGAVQEVNVLQMQQTLLAQKQMIRP